ncbi:addiction module antidote protein [Sphingomonas sp. LaA6.9]|uniref:addiction module antidote protein n=1 Tax=Sphingomonas sp. LaA6.9 TaxID=2919914 RepID=UPI001F4F9B96|nr:addiction module antidote protein [Sphingomonas sp. LaA6.9]MCJ8158358.1 putative addiction module antidote protein [Sphingomonas sp. LaA6.9]
MVNIKPFDAAKHIGTPEAEAAFLSEALASGHAGHIANALGVIAKAHSMSGLAKRTGLNRATLYAALSENGNPTLDTVLKVAEALDLKLEAHPVSGQVRSRSARRMRAAAPMPEPA